MRGFISPERSQVGGEAEVKCRLFLRSVTQAVVRPAWGGAVANVRPNQPRVQTSETHENSVRGRLLWEAREGAETDKSTVNIYVLSFIL